MKRQNCANEELGFALIFQICLSETFQDLSGSVCIVIDLVKGNSEGKDIG